eukprot:NODE_577_length_5827_cov_0.545740.p3 type:complete len:241 gc:universal NODE_577_length_5827_cov_0.545740:2360-1638(-)
MLFAFYSSAFASLQNDDYVQNDLSSINLYCKSQNTQIHKVLSVEAEPVDIDGYSLSYTKDDDPQQHPFLLHVTKPTIVPKKGKLVRKFDASAWIFPHKKMPWVAVQKGVENAEEVASEIESIYASRFELGKYVCYSRKPFAFGLSCGVHYTFMHMIHRSLNSRAPLQHGSHFKSLSTNIYSLNQITGPYIGEYVSDTEYKVCYGSKCGFVTYDENGNLQMKPFIFPYAYSKVKCSLDIIR